MNLSRSQHCHKQSDYKEQEGIKLYDSFLFLLEINTYVSMVESRQKAIGYYGLNTLAT